MPILVIRHRVASFDTWKSVFDEDAPTRRASGSRRERVFRGVADPQEVLIYLDWDDGERAHLFARSAELREALVRAGVSERPDVRILTEVDRPAY